MAQATATLAILRRSPATYSDNSTMDRFRFRECFAWERSLNLQMKGAASHPVSCKGIGCEAVHTSCGPSVVSLPVGKPDLRQIQPQASSWEFSAALYKASSGLPDYVSESLWEELCDLQDGHEQICNGLGTGCVIPKWTKEGLQPYVSMPLLPVDNLSILLGPLSLLKDNIGALNLLKQARDITQKRLLDLHDSITQSNSAEHVARQDCLSFRRRYKLILPSRDGTPVTRLAQWYTTRLHKIEFETMRLKTRLDNAMQLMMSQEKDLKRAKRDISQRLWSMWQTLSETGQQLVLPPARDETLPPSHARSVKTLRVSITIKTKVVSALADTGSEENIISRKLASELGYKINSASRNCKEFILANGKTIAAIGRVRAGFRFLIGANHKRRSIFYVLSEAIEDLIIGCKSLEDTETMTRYDCRLEECTMVSNSCQVMHLSKAQIVKRCYINRELTDATIDTGSMMDLISLKYAKTMGYTIQPTAPEDPVARQADGSLAHFSGKTLVNFRSYHSLITDENRRFKQKRTFYVLDGLSCDVLLGQQLSSQMKAFTKAFLEEKIETRKRRHTLKRSLRAITWLSPIEQKFANFLGNGRLRQVTHSQRDHVADPSQLSFGHLIIYKALGRRSPPCDPSHDADLEFYRNRETDDARENERKHQADLRIEAILDADQKEAERATERELRTQYNQCRTERKEEHMRAMAVAAADHNMHLNPV